MKIIYKDGHVDECPHYKMKKQALGYLGFYFYEIVVPQAKVKRFKPSLGVEEEQVSNMRYEDSMKDVADQIIKEQQRASKIKNNPEEFHWYDEYATLNLSLIHIQMCIRDRNKNEWKAIRGKKLVAFF